MCSSTEGKNTLPTRNVVAVAVVVVVDVARGQVDVVVVTTAVDLGRPGVVATREARAELTPGAHLPSLFISAYPLSKFAPL